MVVNRRQLRELDHLASQQFVSELLAHMKEATPRLCQGLAEREILRRIHLAIRAAESFGITTRRSTWRYVHLLFEIGDSESGAPSSPVAMAILNDSHHDARLKVSRLWRAYREGRVSARPQVAAAAQAGGLG